MVNGALESVSSAFGGKAPPNTPTTNQFKDGLGMQTGRVYSTDLPWLTPRPSARCLLPPVNCYGHWSESFFEIMCLIERLPTWQSKFMWRSPTLSSQSPEKSKQYPGLRSSAD